MKLDPNDLRAYARRDWARVERLARQARASASVEERVRMQVELYEAARALRPGWPSEADRRADLAHHMRMAATLRRAAHVGAR